MSVLNQKYRILIQSFNDVSYCERKIQEIEKKMCALDRNDKKNQTSLKALKDAKVCLREESTELRNIRRAANEDFENEEKKYKAARDKGPDKPPKLEPSSENWSVEGDTLCRPCDVCRYHAFC